MIEAKMDISKVAITTNYFEYYSKNLEQIKKELESEYYCKLNDKDKYEGGASIIEITTTPQNYKYENDTDDIE